MILRILLFCSLFLFESRISVAREAPDVNEWHKNLNTKKFDQQRFWSLGHLLNGTDSATTFSFLDALERKGEKGGTMFQIQLKWLRAYQLYKKNVFHRYPTIFSLFKSALYQAYETGDERLLVDISFMYGEILLASGNSAAGIMYCINAIDLEDRSEQNVFKTSYYERWVLADALFNTQQYEKCIFYARQVLRRGIGAHVPRQEISLNNTIGLCWLNTGNYDSAYNAFTEALYLAKKQKDTVWVGIIKGSLGQYYLQKKEWNTALPLLKEYYHTCLQSQEWSNVANALQMLARIHLIQGNTEQALNGLRSALLYLNQMPQPRYRVQTYSALADVFQSRGNTDSSFYYYQAFTSLRDSLKSIADQSRADYIRAKLEHERSLLSIRNLQQEKELLLVKRNFFITVIVLLSFISLFYLNRQRVKTLHREQLIKQQNIAMQAEIALARERLEQVKQSTIEKTELIERLQQQAAEKAFNQEQQDILNHLTQQAILTDADWEAFKINFSKVYPGFFQPLKRKAPDITTAELRLAALIRLQLSTRQMASMLGISAGSVLKTRQRLRQRLQLSKEVNLEESLTHM